MFANEAITAAAPSRGRPLAWPSFLALTALLLVGCNGSVPKRSTAPAPTRVETSPTLPAPPVPPALEWKDCGAPFQCGTLSVPLDYANPTGRAIKIAAIRRPANDTAARLGSVVTNPGGPGQSGVNMVRRGSQTFQSLFDRFDLVSFDPRGVGASTPAIRCVDGAALDRYFALDPTATAAADRQTLVDANRELARNCEQRNHDLLPFMGTENQARDMDQLRAAIGDDKLTYYGVSYGTFLGTTYARLFPGRVRALVLDGVVDPNLSNVDLVRETAKASEKGLSEFFADCAAHPECEFNNGGQPGSAFDKLFQRLGSEPLSVGSRRIGRGELLLVLGNSLGGRAYNTLARALAAADKGDGTRLLSLFDSAVGRHADGSYDNSTEANNAVLCVDRPSPTHAEELDRLATASAAEAPHFGAAYAYSLLPCEFWAVPATGRPEPARSEGSMLLVGATGDPITRYEWAQAVAAQLQGSALLTRDGAGHSSYRFSECIRRAVDTYLLEVKLPAPSTTCST